MERNTKTWIMQIFCAIDLICLLRDLKVDFFVLFSIIYQYLFMHTKIIYLHSRLICLHFFNAIFRYIDC